MDNKIKQFVIAALVVLLGLIVLTGCVLKPEDKKADGQVKMMLDATKAPEDIGQRSLLGNLSMPPEQNKTEWTEDESSGVRTLSAGYAGISLPALLDFLKSIDKENWYLTGNNAYKGSRSLDIAYDFEAQKLHLDFTIDDSKPEWPEVLPQNLAYSIPVFPYGQFGSFEEREMPEAEKAFMLVYKDVALPDVMAYEETLISSGFELDQEINGQRFFLKNTLFATVSPNALTGEVAIILGSFKVSYVPLPPWPDPLPEKYQRLLSPVGAMCSVTAITEGFELTAEKMMLSEMYAFFTAIQGYYEWAAISESGSTQHTGQNCALKVVSYNTDENRLVMHLLVEDAEANARRSRGGDDPFYFGMTQNTYYEQQAMDGILDEFGQTVEMASWEEIKALYGDRFAQFLDEVGVRPGEDVWVIFKKSGFDGHRHYFLARISGSPREDFLLYDKVGDEAWLGSWYGIKLRAMVKIPGNKTG